MLKAAIFVFLIVESASKTTDVNGNRPTVVTDYAVFKGDQLRIGNEGEGSCKYSGNWKISPAWVLRNNEGTYALSAGKYLGLSFASDITGRDVEYRKGITWEN